MANTGVRSPAAQSGFSADGPNAIDGDDSTFAYDVQFGTGAANANVVSNFAGDDIPAGATINGVKLLIKAAANASYAITKIINTKVSLDGTSGTFSSAAASQNLTTSVADYTFGAIDELWGLDWSDWTDVSDLAVTFQSDQQDDSAGISISAYYEVNAVVYYTAAAADVVPDVPVKIIAGTFTLRSGTLTIK